MSSSQPSVAVLGCGPAGLLCAYAAEQQGYRVAIFSRYKKSDIPGSLHLRAHIPGLTGVYPDNTVTIVRIGSGQDYARKVYGDGSKNTGWDNYSATYPSWNAIAVYDKLWEIYRYEIGHIENIDAIWLREIQKAYEIVISTLPSPELCMLGHMFQSVPYWIKPLPLPREERGRELIVYNGRFEDAWYRYSVLGDKCAIEAAHPAFSGDDVVDGYKAIDNNCDCHRNVIRAGRWAEWKHGILLHHAYDKVTRILKERKAA